MATQIVWCQPCNAPVYDVDGVVGSCSCPDGQLRGLLAMQRLAAQTAAPKAPAAPIWPPAAPTTAPRQVLASVASLPELTPDMLLSGPALAEYRAMAQGYAPATPKMAQRQAQERPQRDGTTRVGGRAASYDGPLEGLWLSGDQMADLGGEYMSETVASQAPGADFEVDFGGGDIDLDLNEPYRGRPNESARFRIDRPPPMPGTPSGARVVAQRDGTGRFAVVADGGETVGNRTAMREQARVAASTYAQPGRNFEESLRHREAVAAAPRITPPPRKPAGPPVNAYHHLMKAPLDD